MADTSSVTLIATPGTDIVSAPAGAGFMNMTTSTRK